MELLFISVFILFSIGFYMLSNSFFNMPDIKQEKKLHSLLNYNRKKISEFDLFVEKISRKIYKYLPMNDLKERKLKNILSVGGNDLSPKLWMTTIILKTSIKASCAIPFFLVTTVDNSVGILLKFIGAAILYFSYDDAKKHIKRAYRNYYIKKDNIERELPKLASSIAQELVIDRNVVNILNNFKLATTNEFKSELTTLVADMTSSGYEAGLNRFAGRMNSTQLSEIIRGLNGVLNGDDGISYFTNLSATLNNKVKQDLIRKAKRVPGKIKKSSMKMLYSMLILYASLLGQIIYSSISEGGVFF